MPGDHPSDPQQAGLVLVVGAPDRRRAAVAAVERLGRAHAEFDDPYAAMAEFCRRPSQTAALLLSLHGLYREELQLIPAVHRAHPHAEVWLTDIDARPAALAEAMRLGADGLLGEDGLHRLGGSPPCDEAAAAPAAAHAAAEHTGRTDEAVPVFASAQRIERVGGSADPAGPTSEDGGPAADQPPRATLRSADDDDAYGASSGEPILTAEELRALLHDQPDTSSVSRDQT